MCKLVVALVLSVACASATPGAVVAAPYVAAPAVVTAHSSQVIARNYNGLAAPLVAAAPYVHAPVAAPLVKAAPYFASPYVAGPVATPLVKAHPYVASPYVSAPLVKAAPYVAAPALLKSAPLIASPALGHYASPFAHYHAAPAYYL